MVFFFPHKSFKGPKLRKTVEEQKQLVAERERKAMENCQSWKGLTGEKDVANYDEGKNLSWQSLSGRLKPRTASRSVSFLLPNLPTTKLVKFVSFFCDDLCCLMIWISARTNSTRYRNHRQWNGRRKKPSMQRVRFWSTWRATANW